MRGGYARTGVFGVIGEGHKFVYVFDRSGSMDGHGGAPLAAAKAELIASLKDLGQMHQFQIIFYNEQPRIFSPTGVAGPAGVRHRSEQIAWPKSSSAASRPTVQPGTTKPCRWRSACRPT